MAFSQGRNNYQFSTLNYQFTLNLCRLETTTYPGGEIGRHATLRG